MTPRSVHVDEAARLAHVSRRTIFYWIEKGWLEAVRPAGRFSTRIDVAALEACAEWRRRENGIKKGVAA